MATVLRTTSLLVIGLLAIGCGREHSGNGPISSQPKATSNLPTVTLKIPGMS